MATNSDLQMGLVNDPANKTGSAGDLSNMESIRVLSMAEKNNIPSERRRRARLLWEKCVRGAMVASKFVNVLATRRQTYVHVDQEGILFFWVKILFALPQFALIPLTLLINVFIIKFYLDWVGVSPAFIAFFQIFARSFDVLTDPLMAHVSDNLTHTRWGRRIPFMMFCPLYAVAFLILVSPPQDSTLGAYWFGGSYLFFYFCDTLVNVPFQALGPELTDSSEERTSLYMYVKLAEGVGIMLGTLTPAGMSNFVGNPKVVYQYMAVFFGVFYIITMYTLIRTVKERPASFTESEEEPAQPFVTSIYRSMRNTAFRPLIIGWILDFAALSFIATMVPFYVTYYVEVDEMKNPLCSKPDKDNNYCYLKSGDHLSYAMAVFFVSGFLSIPIWKYLSRHDRTTDKWYERLKIGKVNAWLTYNVVNVVTNVMFVFIAEKGLYYMYICMIFNGIPIGGQFLINSILADVIDYDEFLNYKRNEGQFTVFASFVPKIIAIPCQSFPLVGMFLLGYNTPEVDNNGEIIYEPQNIGVKWFIRGMFVFAPLVLVSLSFLVKRKYPIKTNEQICKISEGVTLHLQGKPAPDPITGQLVWIEDYSGEDGDNKAQYLVYLLDQFNHSQLLWLLSPHQIWLRHEENNMPLRKSTQRHISEVNNDNEEYSNTGGLCSCFDTKIKMKNVFRTKDDVVYGKDDDGNVIYVSVAGKLEAHGVKEGVKRIKIRVAIWVFIYISSMLTSIIGVSTTIQLLEDPDYAFVPAVFCLSIGLSLTGAGFNILRYRAAGEIREYCEKKGITDETLARCIYPKTKGQRGGELVDDEEEIQQYNTLIDEKHAHPKALKSLTNMNLLVLQLSASDDDDSKLYN